MIAVKKIFKSAEAYLNLFFGKELVRMEIEILIGLVCCRYSKK